MNTFKKITGFLLLLLAPAILCLLVYGAFMNVNAAGKEDINKPIPWVIIITVFMPIAVGLFMFGYYAVKGEFDDID
jgi:hypothetical protein